MKRIFGLVLALVMLVSVLAVLPASAEGETNITDVAVHLDQGLTLVYKLSDGSFEYVPVAAKEMNRVAAPEGYTEGTTSVYEYATKLLVEEGTSDITAALVRAMLNYGAAAQKYFNYETDKLVGTPETDVAALKGVTAPAVEVEDEDGIYLGATLVLEGTLKLRFYFVGTSLEAECDNNTQTSTNKDGCCYFDVPVMPYDLCESVTITTGTTSVTYAPINYLQAKADDAALSEMVASIYAYGVAAKAYYIEYKCEHEELDGAKPIILPTLFSEGTEEGICALCRKTVTKTVAKASATGRTFDAERNTDYKDFHSFGDILGDGHFYPTEENPDGQAIYIEYSMLWTEEFVNASVGGKDYMLLGRFDSGSTAYDSNYDIAYALSIGPNDTWTDPATPGYFDVLAKDGNPVYGDYTYGSDTANCPFIGGYGWHRIGIVVKQIEKDGSYLLNATLYVDGVKLSSHNIKPRTSANLLYTKVNGEYKNTDLTRGIRAFYVPEGKTNGATVDLEIADLYVTAGNGFVMPVAKLATAADVTYTGLDGSARENVTYFEFIGEDDCLAGNHTWADAATVDTEATCTTDGQKSVKCVVCGEIDPDSVEVIESAGQHDLTNETIVTQPTVFSKGLKTAVCSICDEVVSVTINETPATVITMTTSGGSEIRDYEDFDDILGDDHFYPTEENPNGNSLYVEFSFLWNETLANITTSEAYAQFGRINGRNEAGALAPFWFAFGDNCTELWNQVAGGFELGSCTENIYGPRAGEANGEYPGIGGYGWHRIGMEYTQLTETLSDGSNMIVSLYIDGVLISAYYYACDARCLLYTDNGDGTYTDNVNAKVLYYRIAKPQTTGENAYFIVGDMSATVGHGFVKKVTKLDTPTEGTYTTEDGTDIDANVYFEIYESDACADNKHAYVPVPTVDFEPTCIDAGQKSYKCVFCDAVKTEEIPSEGKHVMSNGDMITVPTAFSEGVMTGTCSACGEEFSEAVPMTKIYTEVVTSSANQNYRWYCEPHYIKDLTDEENHFYDENNSLYIEYSLLINDSFDVDLKHSAKSAWFIFGTVGVNSADEGSWDKLGWFHRDANDSACPYVGGVEPNGDVAKFYADNGIVEKQGNYYVMKDELYYGWHRFGVQIHQDYEIVDGEAEYTVTATVFIDGVRIMDITYGGWHEDNLLYTVKVDGDDLVFTDNKDSDIQVTAFVMQRLVPKSSSANVYAPVADVHVTCGSDFVMPVEKLDTPIEGTYSPASGVTLDADRYFAYVD